MPRNKRTAAQQLEQIAKDLRALELRRKGQTYPQIAKQMRCAVSTAEAHVKRALRDMVREAAEEVRLLEESRLDSYLAGLAGGVRRGNPKAVLAAVKIGERRAKLLGVDAPTKTETTIVDATDEQLLDTIAKSPEYASKLRAILGREGA